VSFFFASLLVFPLALRVIRLPRASYPSVTVAIADATHPNAGHRHHGCAVQSPRLALLRLAFKQLDVSPDG
jgi:hypothetical protein